MQEENVAEVAALLLLQKEEQHEEQVQQEVELHRRGVEEAPRSFGIAAP